jgi:hypothetical protein
MNTAERAANFLTATNSHEEEREDFLPIYEPHIHTSGQFQQLGDYWLFTDESVLFAITSEAGTCLICTTKEGLPEDLLNWAIEENRVPDLLKALVEFNGQ